MKTAEEILKACGIPFGLANIREQVLNAVKLSQSEGFNKGFDEANSAREEQIKELQLNLLEQDRLIMKLENKLETEKIIIMKTAEEILKEYIKIEDVKQSETIVAAMIEYGEQFKYDYSKDCKCGNERIGATWCCNQCGLPVSK